MSFIGRVNMKIIHMMCLMALIRSLQATEIDISGVDLPKKVKDIAETLERELTKAEKRYLASIEKSKRKAIKDLKTERTNEKDFLVQAAIQEQINMVRRKGLVDIFGFPIDDDDDEETLTVRYNETKKKDLPEE